LRVFDELVVLINPIAAEAFWPQSALGIVLENEIMNLLKILKVNKKLVERILKKYKNTGRIYSNNNGGKVRTVQTMAVFKSVQERLRQTPHSIPLSKFCI
jgi:hypothetical protein